MIALASNYDAALFDLDGVIYLGPLAIDGVPANEADVVNSTQATLRMLGAELAPGAKVLAVGTDALRQQLAGAGFDVVSSLDDAPDAVVQGYNPTMEWQRLEEAALAVQRGAAWYGTNPDMTRPSERGISRSGWAEHGTRPPPPPGQ